MSTPFDQVLYGYRFVSTTQDDTLQSIAAREMGDGKLWPQLVQINGLVPPYITTNPAAAGSGVLLAGAQIMVSAPISDGVSQDPSAVFLVDMTTDASGQLLDDGKGDFASVSGLSNLSQSLRNRIETEQRELVMHTGYGSRVRKIVGVANGPTAGVLAAQYAKSAVLADPRVRKVSAATAQVVGDRVSVSVEAVPISGAPVTVSASP